MSEVNMVQATTSCTGTQLSLSEQTLGLDRFDLVSDGKLYTTEVQHRPIKNFTTTTLGKILSSDKFIRFDLLARNVIKEGFDLKTECSVGSTSKYQELHIGDSCFVQVGTTYYGKE